MKTCVKCGKKKPFDDFHKCCSSKDGHQSRCKACALVLAAEYYREHKAEVQAYNIDYYKKNCQRIKAKQARLRIKYRSDPARVEKMREQGRYYRRKYRYSNPEYIAECNRKRWARQKKVVHRLRQGEYIEIKGHGCFFCGSKEDLVLAHDIPLSALGPTTRANIFCLCRSCNSTMRTKTLAQMIEQQPLEL